MKILLLYASHFGQTHAIADAIAAQLRSRDHEVELFDATADPPSPEGYDLVVLGSRIELGRHAGDIRNYMRTHLDALARRPTAFFSVSMAAAKSGASADPDGYLATLFEDVGWEPTKCIAFAGGLPYRKYNWFLRFVMKRISRSAGHTTDTSRDHVFTDWSKVRAFADEIAALGPANERIDSRGEVGGDEARPARVVPAKGSDPARGVER
jgi:menaquinone-dependent protoporphyrinogen oxidase